MQDVFEKLLITYVLACCLISGDKDLKIVKKLEGLHNEYSKEIHNKSHIYTNQNQSSIIKKNNSINI